MAARAVVVGQKLRGELVTVHVLVAVDALCAQPLEMPLVRPHMTRLAGNGEMRACEREFTFVVTGDGKGRQAEAVHSVAICAVLDNMIYREIAVVKVFVAISTERMLRLRVQIGPMAILACDLCMFAAQGIPGQVVIEGVGVDQFERCRCMASLAYFAEPSVMNVAMAGDAVLVFQACEFYERFSVPDFTCMTLTALDFLVCSG